jgi:hypothetical protein
MVCGHELSIYGAVTMHLHTSFFCIFSCNEVKQGIGNQDGVLIAAKKVEKET